ncbi:glycosyltransferase, partial [Corallococcus exiguus]
PMQTPTTPARQGDRATFLMVTPGGKGQMKGHLTRVLDLAQSLVARGHRVLVFTEEAVPAEVEASGAELVPVGDYRGIMDRMEAARETLPGWMRVSLLLRRAYWFACYRRAVLGSVEDYCHQLEPLLRREQVDCVVYDYFAFGAGYAAERLGIPAISTGNLGSVIDADGLPVLLRTAPPGRLARRVPRLTHALVEAFLPLRRTRAKLGLPPRAAKHAELFQTMGSSELHLAMVPENILAGVPRRGEQLYAGTIAFDGATAENSATFGPIAPGTVLVSTTSVGQDGGLMRRVLKALDPTGMPVLATTAGARDVPDNLGPHIRTEAFLPHEQVFPHVAALVTHGGWGAVGRALRHGVPMLIIPLFADQPLNAELLEKQGLAYQLSLREATPEAIRERVQALLKDQVLHARVQKLSEELKAMRKDSVAIDTLERLALETRGRRQAQAA